MRGEWLISVSEGVLAVAELLDYAATDEGRPLRRLRLDQVLAAQPDWSMAKARQVVARTVRRSPRQPRSRQTKPRQITVGWLVDHRSSGLRAAAFADATAERTVWAGFPMAGGSRRG
jgi:hypothetical protein